MLYVLRYEVRKESMHLVPTHYPAHSARSDAFHDRGVLLHTGPFEDPVSEGSMAIFTSREAAEEFVRGDPFVTAGIVAKWTVLGWNEAYSAEVERKA